MPETTKQRERFFFSHPDIFLTNADAIKKGEATEMTPVPITCGFCGAELLTWGFRGTSIEGQDNGVVWRPDPERCSCAAAIAFWHNADKMTKIERTAIEYELRKKIERDELEKLLRQSRLVDVFGGKQFQDFTIDGRGKSISSAKAMAEGFAKDFAKAEQLGKGLLFTGPSGTGKTHLAAAAALEICKQRRTVIALEAVELMSRLRSCYDSESRETEERLIAMFTQVDLLMIDDLGKEKPSEWTLEKLFWIIDIRCKRKKPMIVTINYTDQELINRLAGKNKNGDFELDFKSAQSIVSRLHEMTWAVPMVSSDYRGVM